MKLTRQILFLTDIAKKVKRYSNEKSTLLDHRDLYEEFLVNEKYSINNYGDIFTESPGPAIANLHNLINKIK